MKYTKKQINQFRKQSLLNDIQSSKKAVKIVTRHKVDNSMKIHLDRLEQLSEENTVSF